MPRRAVMVLLERILDGAGQVNGQGSAAWDE